jgi:transaldolase
MQIFLDTANINEIEEAASLGIISGVTTNPSLLSKEATGDYEAVTRRICDIVGGPVSVQALLGALAGATYVSIFIGRLDDAGHDGMAVVEDALTMLDNYPELDTQLIAASIRHPLHATYAALAGADIATVPYKVLMQMIQHPMTDTGIRRFLADWKKVAGK